MAPPQRTRHVRTPANRGKRTARASRGDVSCPLRAGHGRSGQRGGPLAWADAGLRRMRSAKLRDHAESRPADRELAELRVDAAELVEPRLVRALDLGLAHRQ